MASYVLARVRGVLPLVCLRGEEMLAYHVTPAFILLYEVDGSGARRRGGRQGCWECWILADVCNTLPASDDAEVGTFLLRAGDGFAGRVQVWKGVPFPSRAVRVGLRWFSPGHPFSPYDYSSLLSLPSLCASKLS